jgi:hypothetical protein
MRRACGNAFLLRRKTRFREAYYRNIKKKEKRKRKEEKYQIIQLIFIWRIISGQMKRSAAKGQ